MSNKEVLKVKYILILALGAIFSACVNSSEFETIMADCDTKFLANRTFAEIKALYVDQTIQIQEDLVIEGYVTSSDREGNFFSVLHFQDKPVDPTDGFRIEFDLIDSHLFFPEGRKIVVKLKGLYLGKSSDVFKLGDTLSVFGNIFVGRLPAVAVREHLFISCEENLEIQPKVIAIEELTRNLNNTLVQFNDVQFINDVLNEPFAIEREETARTLADCEGNEITVLNSGFSDFFEETLPSGNGSIRGVLLRKRENYQLVIRSLDDIDFSNSRCE